MNQLLDTILKSNSVYEIISDKVYSCNLEERQKEIKKIIDLYMPPKTPKFDLAIMQEEIDNICLDQSIDSFYLGIEFALELLKQ